MIFTTFPTLLVASAASGIALAPRIVIGDICGVAEWVLGHSVWTHELADDDVFQRMSDAIRRQMPDMPSRGAMSQESATWQQLAADLVTRHGETVSLARGAGVRGESPLASLMRLVPGADVIAVTPPAEGSGDDD